jgi:RHH-type proline utilization regulon transcriptional repressor/proline dehydrogenase/delta 1-pyrroline-5-carboxylate dehydrogenase
VAENPGILLTKRAKLCYEEFLQRDRVMAELVPRLRSLAMLAKSAGQGFNVDAEEADRLSLSL